MGLWKKIFGPPAIEEAKFIEDAPVIDEIPLTVKLLVKLDETDRKTLDTLANTSSGMSAEDLGQKLGLENMPCLYRLDKLVKNGLVKRSRPMFREPELYEVTKVGRERMAG